LRVTSVDTWGKGGRERERKGEREGGGLGKREETGERGRRRREEKEEREGGEGGKRREKEEGRAR
jgi:hypothetical protein